MVYYIILKNFRCYKYKRIDFLDKGLSLLCGKSGNGKSSIMMAIHFALFGTGTKIIKRGETSCSVELVFDDLKIIRTKKPNQVIVNDIYEDDVAQNIINKKFGEMFHITGYIEQNASNSFIIMNPTDKLHFLEKFAFQDINLGDIKIRNKSLIARLQSDLIKTKAQLDSSILYLNDLKKPEIIEYPLTVKGDNAFKNEEIRYKNCDTKIKIAYFIINKINDEINDLNILNTYTELKDENISKLNEILDNLSIDDDKYIGDDKLKFYTNLLDNMINLDDINKLKEKITEMKNKEIEDSNLEINRLSKNLWKEYTKKESEDSIKDTKIYLDDAKQISFLIKQLHISILPEEILQKTKELNKKVNKKIYNCPSCDEKLISICDKLQKYYHDDNVDDCNEDISDKCIKLLEKEILILQNKFDHNKQIQKQINDIQDQYEDELNENELKNDFNNMQSYYNTNIKIENKINDLQNNNKSSSSIILLEKDLKKLESKAVNNYDENILSIEEIRNIIINEKKNKENLYRFEKRKNDIETDRNNQIKQNEIQIKKHNDKYKEVRKMDILNQLIIDQKVIINEHEKNRLIHKVNLLNIEKYKKYIEEMNIYISYKTRVDDLEIKYNDETDKYNTAVLLKDKIAESEMISIMNTIESINTHAQIYLESFFNDNPISVVLKCFKENKKSEKPQINIEIYYKDDVCDIGSLSGGEFARVVLAFTLALSDMFNTPLLLLDESTASLDEETTSIVFECIREHMREKPILVVGHQIVQGIFDEIIYIS